MRTILVRPHDKQTAKHATKTALFATAALALTYTVTPSRLTAASTTATTIGPEWRLLSIHAA